MTDPNTTGDPQQEPTSGQPAPEFGQRLPQYEQNGQNGQTPQYGQQAQAGGTPQPGQTPGYDQTPQYNQNPQYGQQQAYPFSPIPQMAPQYDANGNQFGQEPPLDKPWYGIGFGPAIQRFFKKYAVFSGRASRGEFWWFILFNFLVAIALSFLSLFSANLHTWVSYGWDLAILVPMLALGVRRLHDANFNGWLIVIPSVLTYGGNICIQLFAMDDIQRFAAYVQANSTPDGYPGDISTTLGITAIFGVLMLVGSILWLVFMCLPSKAAGARFDKAPQQNFQDQGHASGDQTMPNNPGGDYQQPNFRQAG
ncbi:MAG: DUF805 domain-containing protein [Bifidobacterium psychraerophilum]|uniref:DUF805 domain-containing protein n=1 Tax=Bifidobacterium psychraerophilum TaxID=218140 RepID=UPI0039E94B3E